MLYHTVSKEPAHSRERYYLYFVIIHGYILEISWDISEVGSYNILFVSKHKAGFVEVLVKAAASSLNQKSVGKHTEQKFLFYTPL